MQYVFSLKKLVLCNFIFLDEIKFRSVELWRLIMVRKVSKLKAVNEFLTCQKQNTMYSTNKLKAKVVNELLQGTNY